MKTRKDEANRNNRENTDGVYRLIRLITGNHR